MGDCERRFRPSFLLFTLGRLPKLDLIPIWILDPREVPVGGIFRFNRWSERKRVEKLRYMHRHPVKYGLVAEPEHWEWSSYRSYAYQQEGRTKMNQWAKAVMKIRSAPQVRL